MKQDGQLVDEGNVDIALGIFDDFRRFCHSNAARSVGAGHYDEAIERIDKFRHLGRGARCDFLDIGDAMLLVARINPFGAVTAEEILIILQA